MGSKVICPKKKKKKMNVPLLSGGSTLSAQQVSVSESMTIYSTGTT